MGLDVSAYAGVEAVECDRWDECSGEHIHLYRNPDFPDRADGLETGCYTVAATLPSEQSFHASYGGYSRWREWLSNAVLGVSPKHVWRSWSDFAGRPFSELINFADNEGIFGPVTCAKLAKDFADYAQLANDAEFGPAFQRISNAFSFAAEGGVVEFH